MVKGAYVPDRGDIVWLSFSPQSGHEQAGRRPALVLSPAAYNGKTDLMTACPITSRVKGYPFETRIRGTHIDGVVLSDQVKSLDWKTRNATFADRAEEEVLREVREKLIALLD